MKTTFKHAYCLLQLTLSILITLVLGVVPMVRCIINHSSPFYLICFAILTTVGATLLVGTSVTELREAKRD